MVFHRVWWGYNYLITGPGGPFLHGAWTWDCGIGLGFLTDLFSWYSFLLTNSYPRLFNKVLSVERKFEKIQGKKTEMRWCMVNFKSFICKLYKALISPRDPGAHRNWEDVMTGVKKTPNLKRYSPGHLLGCPRKLGSKVLVFTPIYSIYK